MSTFGSLHEVEGHHAVRTLSTGSTARWNYIEPVSRHNRSKHWVDDHNQRRHAPIDLSFTWRTRWWPTRQFTFFLGVAEVNAANTRARALRQTPAPVLEFRRDLANEMLNNTLGRDLEPARGPATRARRSVSASDGIHRLEERPLNTTKWLGTSWKPAKDPYQKTVCSGADCKSRCRTYCACNKAACLCLECFNVHINNV
jgi:hypothetical protein